MEDLSSTSPSDAGHQDWDLELFSVPPAEGKSRFHDFELPLELMHAICDLGFEYCMPVQAQTLPHTLSGSDATARAQTGTGKSAAFLVTIIARLLQTVPDQKPGPGTPRALILAPTRELVLQIEKDASALLTYTGLTIVPVFGGMDYNRQQQQLQGKTVDIIAATPGRLIDFMGKRLVRLNRVEVLVIDEADRMMDMGFIPDMRKIIYQTPHKKDRQTLFFSATLSPEILRMASQWTKEAVHVEIDPERAAADSVTQKIYLVTEQEKLPLLYNLVTGENLERVLLFVNRKDTARRLHESLLSYQLNSEVLSGDVAQKKRVSTLERFREGEVRILVATDVAARGLHIDGISHVINYDLPQDPEHYVHRIGRTGRAGAEGISVSFADEMSSFYIPEIEKVLGGSMKCEYPDERLLTELPEPKPVPRSRRPRPDRKRRPSSGNRRPRTGRSAHDRGKSGSSAPRRKQTRRRPRKKKPSET